MRQFDPSRGGMDARGPERKKRPADCRPDSFIVAPRVGGEIQNRQLTTAATATAAIVIVDPANVREMLETILVNPEESLMMATAA